MQGTDKAVQRMRKVYPEFDLFELEDDTKEIFQRLYEAYLRRELEYVEKVAEDQALGYFKASIIRWEEMQVKPKVDRIWFLDSVELHSAEIIQSFPVFQFMIRMQDVDCLVSTKPEDEDKDVIISGGVNNITSNTYLVSLMLHDNPDLEAVGHVWKIVDFRLAETHKMLV